MFSRPPYYSGITADCGTVFLDVIVFVCVMKPSAFHSLSTIPLISATVDIRNTILRNSRRGPVGRDDGARRGECGVLERGGTSAGRCRREEKKRRQKEKQGMAAVIAVADGYEVKADGVSD